MDERTLIFQKVQKGEMIFTLEKDRRSGYPIFDTARIVKVGESKPMASGAKDGFVNSVELVIQDSVSQLTVYLPSQSDEGIYNGVYYTTDVVNIINEVTMQKHNALNILNNRPNFGRLFLNAITFSIQLTNHLLLQVNLLQGLRSSVNTWTNEYPLKRLCYRELLRSWDWINLNNSKNYAK